MNKAEWYVDWFNSPYYHLLYNNRNHSEAAFFIDKLCDKLQLKSGAKIWDLACGKGRHSIALNKKGYDVYGSDLSENNIREASLSANSTLHFHLHDMRQPFNQDGFEAVFNLFTSMGYFENFEDNYLVFKNVGAALKPGGVFVVDFFNADKVVASFKKEYHEERGDISFRICKRIENHAIRKRIEFKAGEKSYYFEESVSLLSKRDFEDLASSSGLTPIETYGNYNLEPYDPSNSDRLILIFKR